MKTQSKQPQDDNAKRAEIMASIKKSMDSIARKMGVPTHDETLKLIEIFGGRKPDESK